ncbi:VOC family protein [Nocardia sp. NPDC052112]|uniref:VOC family protein n=1 Tax=Nocardia sp. NPDC052112 TaxID=3155646 RepID=UPI0034219BE1
MAAQADAEVVAFARPLDLDRSRRCYADVLDPEFVGMTPFACVALGPGITMRITRVNELVPQQFTILGWVVADSVATIDELTARGVKFHRYDGMDQDDHGIRTTPGGDKIAWFPDPDGNVLSLTEFAVGRSA